ncbi:MAG: hypothetical protein ACYTFG_17470, partial [Planctomycetota bacterium]
MCSKMRIGLAVISGLVLFFMGCTKEDPQQPGGVFPTITVSLAPASPSGTNTRPDAQDFAVILLHITGDPDQDVDLDDISLTRLGTVTGSNIFAARLVVDDGATSIGVYDNSEDTLVATGSLVGGEVRFTLSPSVTIPTGGAIDLFAVYDLSPTITPAGGATFGLRLDSGADVGASSSSGGLSTNVSGAPVDGSMFTVVGRLQVSAGSSPPSPGTQSIGAADVALLQLNLAAPDEDVTVSTITFTGSASPGQNSDVAGVKLVVDANNNGQYESGTDGPVLGSTQTFGGGATATFSVNRAITQGASEDWLVLYDLGVSHAHGDQLSVSFQSSGDTGGTGGTSAQAAYVDVASPPVSGATVTVQDRLQITPGTPMPPAANVTPSATDIPMLLMNLLALDEN